MPRSRDANPDERVPASSSPEAGPPHNAPLVIVSEGGRHSTESRRVVRAQAARASAAQSRVTRARNREEREGTARESPLSPVGGEEGRQLESPAVAENPVRPPEGSLGQTPLLVWLASALDTPLTTLLDSVHSLPGSAGQSVGGLASFQPRGALGGVLGGAASTGQSLFGVGGRELPRAVPRGFAALQQKIPISDTLMGLLGRTSCFDFESPGVETRLHQLLFDIITTAVLSPVQLSGHPIQSYLRVACTCLTIFQGQRANGAPFARDSKYQSGLEAAWSEAMLLDPNALVEPKSAEASLWAVFIISVTTNSSVVFFQQLIHGLLHDLQLHYWPQVRKVLLGFIYPVSFLDERCKSFYENLPPLQSAVG